MTAAASAVASQTSNNSVLQTYLTQQAQNVASTTASTANAASASSTAAAATSATATWGNFTTYLNILTTQLQNQDPTNATDPNQFTEELVQFAGVEQQIDTNSQLTTLVKSQGASSLATGAGYIGNYVEAPSTTDQVELQGGSTEFNYSLASAASSVSIDVKNSAGTTVATLSGAPGSSGSNYVTWNGQDADGTQLADGTYTLAVTALDSTGAAVVVNSVAPIIKVTNVASNTDGTLQLSAGDVGFSSGDVTHLYTSTTLPTATALTAQTTSDTTS